MKRGKLVQITAVFFAFMLCFTILSRAADQMGVAVVTTERPQNRVIEHAVRTSGKIVQNQEMAVTTLPDQRVTAIYVREGQRVKRGDLLFEIDLTLLEEKILNQKQEMEKQELQIKDAESQKEVSAQQKANLQAQAAEQYSLSARQAGVQLERARQQLAQAKKKLKKFRKTSGTGEEDSEIEDVLLQALEDKTDAYVAAQGELRALEWEIENAVWTAKQNASEGTLSQTMAGASLTAENRNFTRAEDAERPEIISGTENISTINDTGGLAGEFSDEGDGIDGSNVMPEEAGADLDIAAPEKADIDLDIVMPEETGAGSDSGFSGETGADTNGGFSGETSSGLDSGLPGDGSGLDIDFDIDLNIETDAVTGSGTDAGGGDDPDAENAAGSGSDTGNYTDPGVFSGNAESDDKIVEDPTGLPASSSVTPDELARIEQTVREGYSQQLAKLQKKVSDAQAEKESAEAALMQYQKEQSEAGNAQDVQTAQQLAADVRAAQQAYEDAALASSAAAVTSGRAVATANIADPSNSSDRMGEITYEQMELTLEKLEGLKEANGQVCAEADGLVTRINIMTGEKTLDTTAILMADLSKGYRFTADITKEQQKYIGTGDLVRLTSGDGKQKLEDLPVESVAADESDENVYHVTVQIPEDTFEIGMNVNLDFVRKSAVYPVTVPLAALHLDARRQAYVLTVEEYGSVMGIENRVRRVNVVVQEQNESYAALAEGVIESGQEIIVQSDKAVDDGSRVRVR